MEIFVTGLNGLAAQLLVWLTQINGVLQYWYDRMWIWACSAI